MKRIIISSTLAVLTLAGTAFAAGPYAPTNWPPTIDTNKIVHYLVTDAYPGFTVPSTNWANSLFRQGGISSDQAIVAQQVCGPLVTFTGDKANGRYMNFADQDWKFWNTQPQIDILVQVYGDTAMMLPPGNTNTRVWRFQQSNGSTYVCPPGTATQSRTVIGAAPTNNLPNYKWNWLLFSITNEPVFICTTNSGNRYVGSTNPTSYTGNMTYGGRNGGTIRVDAETVSTWLGLNIHAMAWGEAGAFGIPLTSTSSSPPPVPAIRCRIRTWWVLISTRALPITCKS